MDGGFKQLNNIDFIQHKTAELHFKDRILPITDSLIQHSAEHSRLFTNKSVSKLRSSDSVLTSKIYNSTRK